MRVKVAHVRLCASRTVYVRAYPRETQEMVFDAHERAFVSFGGVPLRGIYENMKTAVTTEFTGKDRLFNRARTGIGADVIAIDGKTVRRSKGANADIHMVSAFAARQRLVLGQVKVADKANEIVAIPKLLEMLDIEGAIVTIDAMGCQRDIAQKIIDGKADNVLALKGNQGTLRQDLELLFREHKARQFSDTTVSTDMPSVDGDHGRIETRTATVIHDVAWLQERHGWPGLNAIVIIDASRELRDRTEHETRFFITSLTLPADQLGPIVRSHWAIENSLHWVMDMVFRDDECRLRTDNAPANFTTIKHTALNLIRRAPGKDSIRLRRKIAAWDDDFLASLITN